MAKAKQTVEHHICSDILIFNDKHELALQLRSANDDSYPGYWDFSAGGHLGHNEEFQMAAERETLEELGVSGRLKFISRKHFQYPEWNSPVLRDVDVKIYKMLHNGPFTTDPVEVEKVVFFDLPTIQKMIDKGDKFHPEFLLAWKRGIIIK